MSTSRVLLLNDDWGGRVCPQCQTADADYVDTLFAYSAYTKRDPVRGDTLFLAAQTHEHRTVMVEFSRVPYRLFLAPQDFRTIALRGEMVHAEFRHCIRTLDSFCHQQQEFVEVRFYSRRRYMDAYHLLVNAKLPVVIDGAHDALHGLDAVLNLGIPGACATLRFKSMAAVHVTDSHWRIDTPANVCAHGILPRMPVLQRVITIAWNVDGTMSIGFDKQEERYEVANAREVAAIVEKFRPTVVLVREKEKTLLRLHQSAPALFSSLLSLLPCCLPSPPGANRPFLPGLGVLVFDVATNPGPTTDVPMHGWVDAYRSSGWLEGRWNKAVASRTGMHDCLGAYEAFTAAMMLRYALTRTVCNLSAEARAHYTGGLTIPPRPSLQLEGPVTVFDFVSMYPSIACIINAGKDTYVAEGGHWDLGEGLGGFSTVRPGSLAAELKERLEERLRILDDPAMQTRATFLKQTINTMVGMSGHKTNPYSDTRVTGCITATGRRLLEACHRSVSDITLAGYTDSLFLKLPRPPTSKDPLDAWLSRSLVAQHEVRFKSAIKNELDDMTRTFRPESDASVRFQCKEITITGLFSGKAHAYAVGYLMLDKTNGEGRVDVQVKGSLKSTSMECTRAFNDALIRISVVGEFLMSEGGIMRLGDIHTLTSAAPVCVMTSVGWKTAVNVTMSTAQRGTVEAIVRYSDDTESRHWFLPQANADGLVEVTHAVCTEKTGCCIDRRRLSVVAMTKMFCKQLCHGCLPLSIYAIDKTGNVLAKLDSGSSKALPPSEVVRNGQCLDLEEYRQRWIKNCVDNLTCRSCRRYLTDADECRYIPSQNGEEPALIHESCSAEDGISLEKISASVLSSSFKTALSAIVVAGTRNALEAVKNLIDLHEAIDIMVSREQPPTQTYGDVLAQLKATVTDGESSKDYTYPPRAFLCLPDGQDCWFCIPSKPTSKTILDLVYRATRILVRHGRYRGRASVLEAIAAYPAHRLRISPPPVFTADKKAPTLEWEKVVTELAESPTRPKLTTTTSFHCQTCATVYNLEIGACGHLACKVCSIGWKTCNVCKVEWQGLAFANTPRMNYHPDVFPFEDWYTYLPATGWYVYSGPDELIYDSSAKHIICLARGELHQ